QRIDDEHGIGEIARQHDGGENDWWQRRQQVNADENAPRVPVIGNSAAQQHEKEGWQHQRHLRNANARRRLIQNLRYQKGKDDELDAKADKPACLTAKIIIEPYPARSRKL